MAIIMDVFKVFSISCDRTILNNLYVRELEIWVVKPGNLIR